MISETFEVALIYCDTFAREREFVTKFGFRSVFTGTSPDSLPANTDNGSKRRDPSHGEVLEIDESADCNTAIDYELEMRRRVRGQLCSPGWLTISSMEDKFSQPPPEFVDSFLAYQI